MIVRAVGAGAPELVPAGHGGDICGVLAYLTQADDDRVSFFWHEGGIGHGASAVEDGMSALTHPITAGTRALPAELLETRMPLVRTKFELVQDSGGAGRRRGGLSATAEYRVIGVGTCVVIAEKTRASEVVGVDGGHAPPVRNSIAVFAGTEREIRLGKKSDIALRPGDVIVTRPAGGGGYGDPIERETHRVWADVRNGYVSMEQAAAVYGVLFNDDGSVDQTRTESRRRDLEQVGEATKIGDHEPIP
jgi:N-methylhydantoinase B